MSRKDETVKHRPVIDGRRRKVISQDPAFKHLKEIFDGMTGEEKRRTIEYLENEISPERTGSGDSATHEGGTCGNRGK